MIMYDIRVRNLASVYLDAQNIKTSGSALADLLTRLGGDLVPDTVQEMTPTGIVQRLMLRDQEHQTILLLQTRRFDFATLGSNDLGDNVPAFCQAAAESFVHLLDHYNMRAHRIALVQEGLLGEMQPGEFATIAKRLLTMPTSLDQDSLFEWDWRQAHRIQRNFNGKDETSNTIVTIKRCQGKVRPGGVLSADETEFDRLRVDLDVNTSPVNDDPRFDSEDISAFFAEVPGWHKELEQLAELLLFDEGRSV